MVIKKRSIIITIIICFIAIGYLYRDTKIEQITDDLLEHSLVVAEPMWNLDTEQLDKYLETVAKKNNYHSLKLIDDGGFTIFETTIVMTPKFERAFAALGLIPKVHFTKDILHDNQAIGRIEIDWRDTSIYFYSYSLLIFILLVMIINLYSSVFTAKKSLELKIVETENAMGILQNQKDYIEGIFNVVPEGLITIDHSEQITGNNKFFDTIVKNWSRIIERESAEIRHEILAGLLKHLKEKDQDHFTISMDGQTIHIEYSSAEVSSSEEKYRVVSLRDSTKINAMKRELAQTQKLESVGRLASGIAHEINTPTQYVLSNIDFLSESYQDIAGVMNQIGTLLDDEKKKSTASPQLNELTQFYHEADWDYLQEEIPNALQQSREGLRRTAKIVSAMKHFSHPTGSTPVLNDLNSAIQSTVAVTTNEWKYVAEIELQLEPDLPLVTCFLDELNQVFLVMIVNSAHAIEEKYGKDGEKKGKIIIKTESTEDSVSVIISDDGNGIPQNIKDKVFDPFFTTKELHKGTGQGLAIAYDTIVNQHNGTISLISEEKVGTSFIISLSRKEST